MKKLTFEKIDINDDSIELIPAGKDLVIAEQGNEEETALVLYGWDEVGMMDSEFTKPVYGFM